jgi:hypothetical protein
MPMINIEFDDAVVSDKEILLLSNAIQKIVSETTHIEDVFVYANSARIKVKIAPIEIFIRMSAHKIKDRTKLVEEIKQKLTDWKAKSKFKYKINMSFIPMDWNIEIGI